MRVAFAAEGWEDYTSWVDDRKMWRINRLITEASRAPASGIGKPEALRGDLSGYWSRRIDQEHRLVYTVDSGAVVVVQCRHHY